MGGMEEHMLQLAQGLVCRGFRVVALCSPRPQLAPLREAFITMGVMVHDIPERTSSPMAAPQRLSRLIRAMRMYPDALLHLHFTGHRGGVLFVLAARLAGMRAVLRTDHNPPDLPISRSERWLVRIQDMTISRLVLVSDQSAQLHVRLLGRDRRKCRVVHNGIEPSNYPAGVSGAGVRDALGLTSDAEVVGTVSRLGEWSKGLPNFITMAARVAEVRARARFLIVGEGPLRDELMRQAADLDIADRVIFAGRVPVLAPYLAAMQIFVVPSLREGGPITLLEALAMARPVVATAVGMVPEVIQDGVTGRIVPPGDPWALADGAIELLSDPHRAEVMGRRGQELVVSRFTTDSMVNGLTRVYAELAEGSRVPVGGGSPLCPRSPMDVTLSTATARLGRPGVR
jgi:glycosyltransferase involved in cell wall biosynthesis